MTSSAEVALEVPPGRREIQDPLEGPGLPADLGTPRDASGSPAGVGVTSRQREVWGSDSDQDKAAEANLT